MELRSTGNVTFACDFPISRASVPDKQFPCFRSLRGGDVCVCYANFCTHTKRKWRERGRQETLAVGKPSTGKWEASRIPGPRAKTFRLMRTFFAKLEFFIACCWELFLLFCGKNPRLTEIPSTSREEEQCWGTVFSPSRGISASLIFPGHGHIKITPKLICDLLNNFRRQ